MDLYGTVSVVTAQTLGDSLTTAATSGDGTVTVYDASDFPELGGTVRVGGADPAAQVADYTSADRVTGIIDIVGTLAASWPVDTPVELWDTTAADVYVDYRALVALPGDQANSDVLDCSVNHALIPLLPQGIRDPGEGESVTITSPDGGTWTVVNILGRSPSFDGTALADGTVGRNALSTTIGTTRVTFDTVAPTSPAVDDLWYDATNGYQLNQWDGAQWVPYQFGANSLSVDALNAKTIIAAALVAGVVSAGSIGASQILDSSLTNCDLVIDPAGGTLLVYTLSGTTTTTITTTGAGSFPVPAGVTSVKVESWGAGGGGGGGNRLPNFGSVGGGGGEYARVDNYAVTPLASVAYNIGVGGTAGAPGSDGGDGGLTYFDSTVGGVVANGGTGARDSFKLPGASGSTNQFHFGGGGNGGSIFETGGGGGSSGGTSQSGNPGGDAVSNSTAGAGGSAPLGGAAGGVGGTPNNLGTAGSAPGGGGGGGGGLGGGHSGGAGARGQLRITYGGTRTLIASIAGAAGTDQYGISYPAGVTFNNRAGTTSFNTNLASSGTTEVVGYSQAVPVTAGRRYKVTVRAYVGVGSNGDGVVTCVRYNTAAVTNTSTKAGQDFVCRVAGNGAGNAVSAEYSREFVAASTTTLNVAIGVRTASGGGGLNSTIFSGTIPCEVAIEDVGQ